MKKVLTGILLMTSFFVLAQQKSKVQSNYSAKNKSVTVYTTAEKSNFRLSKTDTFTFKNATQALEVETSVFVSPNKKFQSVLGIGGAITDATAEVFSKLSEGKQKELITAYYNVDKGIGYSLARTNIHSCDFSSGSYTYVNEGDKDLKTFSIQHDLKDRIPMIKKSIAEANGNLTLFASPWSPPAFMKTTNNMLKGGKLKPEYCQSWANYYTKFIAAYQKEGIPIWGISVQNEPMASQTWESCIYTAEEERDFLKTYLGPTMKKAGFGSKKIIVWDHNRDLMTERASVIFDDPEASKYAWGIGFHWYENWSGGEQKFDNVGKAHEMYPDKNIMFTEGCVERFDASKYQYWPNGEKYGESMINDFNNGTVGWTDWNILLDQNGGPNHVGNFCFAPVHADLTKDEIIYTPSYYYIGHFSKFIRPGAKRISSVASRNDLLTTSFANQKGGIVTVVMNKTNKEIIYNLFVGNQVAEIKILPHSIQSLVY
ncbi:MAG TPA: glycoside hydrolase family 30 protein [Flavobacterium sp.]|uniref:glycoside hydrolase family 30 protein n=1 Tax=Flavobacterium sp. TaxID=239 RepID=UPI002DB7D77B|nr:glycoside hydrolase family 30 protein [Flavobacterium sp.]HEU4789426.1 glycoside hydrolase family 30 protein [Flavobacterium sp.]